MIYHMIVAFYLKIKTFTDTKLNLDFKVFHVWVSEFFPYLSLVLLFVLFFQVACLPLLPPNLP